MSVDVWVVSSNLRGFPQWKESGSGGCSCSSAFHIKHQKLCLKKNLYQLYVILNKYFTHTKG